MTNYIREEDRQSYLQYCLEHANKLGRALPKELWHYTTADGLIKILETGTIFSTQISCLNDNLEQRYFGDLVLAEVKARQPKNSDEKLAKLYEVTMERLVNRDFSATPHFVTCFSENEDDLNQWRGYGGGECGYAIGFDPNSIYKLCNHRLMTFLLPMNYKAGDHETIVNDVANSAERFFLEGIERGVSDVREWAEQFVEVFASYLDIVASILKHPKFSGENERRMMTFIRPGDLAKLEFRQKRTLLARHLPLEFIAPEIEINKLPITRIFVGPGAAQQVTKISVSALLQKHGYGNIKVEPSSIPYRVP